MKGIQKGFKAEPALAEMLDKIADREHINLSSVVKRACWIYAEENYPELAEEAKRKLSASGS